MTNECKGVRAPQRAAGLRGLHRYARLVVAATFILIFAGGLVTSTGSALAVEGHHAVLQAELYRTTYGFLPSAMTETARTMPLPGPAAIAIHHYGDVPRTPQCGILHIFRRCRWLR